MVVRPEGQQNDPDAWNIRIRVLVNPMSTKEAGQQESVVEKRAKYEQFEFIPCDNGIVNVHNTSYNEPGHVYSVDLSGEEIENHCSCPAAEYGNVDGDSGLCKHALAVRDNERVLKSDGGSSCPHDHPDCEGLQTDSERPVLCFDCWERWASQ